MVVFLSRSRGGGGGDNKRGRGEIKLYPRATTFLVFSTAVKPLKPETPTSQSELSQGLSSGFGSPSEALPFARGRGG